MANIIVLTEATNIQVNDEFWAKVNSLKGSYYKEVNQINIPQKPIYNDLENAWIYEILNEALFELMRGDLIILDGRMLGQIIYNLAVGSLLSTRLNYGSVLCISDEETTNLLNAQINDIETVDEIVVTPSIPDQQQDNKIYITLEQSLEFFKTHEAKIVRIDNSYSGNNSTIETLLGLLYYRSTEEIDYSPVESNAFVNFIINS